MRICLITPHVGRKDLRDFSDYVRTWQMEPLPIATLAGLIPNDVEIIYFDERIEPINFEVRVDAVMITVETYTAKRAYEIAEVFHRRKIKVILGGYHVMLCPDEAAGFADSIVVGFAENLMRGIIADLAHGQLQPRYIHDPRIPYDYQLPDRSILNPGYLKLSCVETGRGCPMHCNFCSITAANNGRFYPKSINLVIAEIASLKHQQVFFVDDNFVGNVSHAKNLCRALMSHFPTLRWVGQGTLTMARDEELLRLMAGSGCQAMLIGFESLSSHTLSKMNKQFNAKQGEYWQLIDRIHSYGIGLYGTFIFGYPGESAQDILDTAEKAIEFGLFIAAFNHLVPFPGTPLYEQLQIQSTLTDAPWWLSPTFRFNDVPFSPHNVTAQELRELALKTRRRFYSLPAIISRGMRNPQGNLNSLRKAVLFAGVNRALRQEIAQKDGLPLGDYPWTPKPFIHPQGA